MNDTTYIDVPEHIDWIWTERGWNHRAAILNISGAHQGSMKKKKQKSKTQIKLLIIHVLKGYETASGFCNNKMTAIYTIFVSFKWNETLYIYSQYTIYIHTYLHTYWLIYPSAICSWIPFHACPWVPGLFTYFWCLKFKEANKVEAQRNHENNFLQ